MWGLVLLFSLVAASSPVFHPISNRNLPPQVTRGTTTTRAFITGENLLFDPGFEQFPTSWNQYVGTGTQVSGRNGYGAQLLNGLFYQSFGASSFPSVPFTLGISGWSYSEEAVAGIYPYSVTAEVSYLDSSYDLFHAEFSLGTHDWQYSSTTFPITKEIEVLFVDITYGGETGSVIFDDVSLNVMTEPPTPSSSTTTVSSSAPPPPVGCAAHTSYYPCISDVNCEMCSGVCVDKGTCDCTAISATDCTRAGYTSPCDLCNLKCFREGQCPCDQLSYAQCTANPYAATCDMCLDSKVCQPKGRCPCSALSVTQCESPAYSPLCDTCGGGGCRNRTKCPCQYFLKSTQCTSYGCAWCGRFCVTKAIAPAKSCPLCPTYKSQWACNQAIGCQWRYYAKACFERPIAPFSP